MRPQAALKLEKEATCDIFKIYILDGFRGKVPTDAVWMQLQPLLNRIWFEALLKKGLKTKDLEEVVSLILEESEGRNPLHQRCMELLHCKKAAANHSEFLFKMEELVALIEFEKMTEASFITHLFIEQADTTMAKLAGEILRKKPEGDINNLRTTIKQIESSTW